MKNKDQIARIAPILFGFFIMGFCDVVGIASTNVKADFGLSDTMSNMIPVSLFTMFLFFSIPTGILMNHIGRKKTVLLSNAITVIAMFLPLVEYNFATCLVAFALLGIANTMLQVSLNPLLNNVISGEKLFSGITAGQFIKAISSFCAPFLAAVATRHFSNWQHIFTIYGIITFLLTIWMSLTPIEREIKPEKANSFHDVFRLLKDKTILLLFLGIVFLVGIDVGVNTAGPKILMERLNLDSISAGYGASVFFAFRTAGAFIGIILLVKFSPKLIFKITTVTTILALIALFFANDKMSIFAIYAVIGFSIANTFSILFSMALKSNPDKANEISGLMITGIFGGAVVPFLMGITSDKIGSQNGSIIVILICAIYLLFCAFAIKTSVAESAQKSI
ncbi:MFS transporter [Flavobacterium qiangtangense]|uniref:MFS transporter n=1 Tax=Flavobacterium qiangtangense TaxID=1442595 RepID=A0ABW1PJ87_9FLAO